MNVRTELACAWAGPLYVLLFGIGLLVAGFIPPPSPGLDAEGIAQLYREHPTAIRIGLLIVMGAQGLFAVFCAELCVQLRRIEGEQSPLAFAQLGLAMLTALTVILTLIPHMAAAFRPEARSAESLQLLSDISWLPFVGAWFTVVPQWIITGVVILQDERDKPILPRWSAYANFWIAVLSLPSTGLFFLKSGPFAWNGLLSFWLAAAAFFAWAVVMAVVLIRAIREQAASLRA